MNVTFACPNCEQAARADVTPAVDHLECPHCAAQIAVPADAYDEGRLRRCLVCPSTELFVRKDFPQRLGVAIVVVGFAVSCVMWYFYLPGWTFAVLFATVALDLLLYLVTGNAVMCYRCKAEYRFLENADQFESFNLETFERYRQQEARLKQHETKRPAREPARSP